MKSEFLPKKLLKMCFEYFIKKVKKVLASHQLVSFNINGILYNRTTNDQGEAKINLNLLPGEYIITSEYGFEKEGNTIKIEA